MLTHLISDTSPTCVKIPYARTFHEVISISLSSGVFPDRLKISKIIPIFKSDNASLAQNYRPISILHAFSKIFERALYNRIFQFLGDNEILFKHQFAFRPGHSTSHALINFVNKAANAVDHQKYLSTCQKPSIP